MKKIFLTVFLLTILVYPIAGQTIDGGRLAEQAQKARLDKLAADIVNNYNLMNDAFDKKQFKIALSHGEAALKAIEETKPLLPAERPAGPAPYGEAKNLKESIHVVFWAVGYELSTREGVALAKVSLGKLSLADAIRQNEDLTHYRGYFAYLSGNIQYMHADFLFATEAFRESNKCKPQVQKAFEEGLIKFDAAHECED